VSVIGPLLLSGLVIVLSGPYLVSAGRRMERHVPPPVAARTRQARRAGGKALGRGVRSARHVTGATVPRIVASAASANWLASREHKRAEGQNRPPRRPVLARMTNFPRTTDPDPPEPGTVADVIPMAAAAGRSRSMPAPPPAPPYRPRSAAAPAPAQERTPAMTSPGTGAGADLFAALGVLLGHARAGGIRAKQRTMATTAEAFDFQGGQLDSFAVALSEPDAHYPPHVWEQVQRAAAHLHAASQCMADGSSAVSALIATTLGEVGANSPHHRELAEH